ncbi:MAG: amidohydrolase, partial [Atribacterota bacterium]
MNVRELSEKYQNEIVALRREFHQNPELSWQEYNTAARIEKELNKIGINDTKRIAGTGVVGSIKGEKGNKVVALRADIDALLVQEENETSYRSQNDGIMHA